MSLKSPDVCILNSRLLLKRRLGPSQAKLRSTVQARPVILSPRSHGCTIRNRQPRAAAGHAPACGSHGPQSRFWCAASTANAARFGDPSNPRAPVSLKCCWCEAAKALNGLRGNRSKEVKGSMMSPTVRFPKSGDSSRLEHSIGDAMQAGHRAPRSTPPPWSRPWPRFATSSKFMAGAGSGPPSGNRAWWRATRSSSAGIVRSAGPVRPYRPDNLDHCCYLKQAHRLTVAYRVAWTTQFGTWVLISEIQYGIRNNTVFGQDVGCHARHSNLASPRVARSVMPERGATSPGWRAANGPASRP